MHHSIDPGEDFSQPVCIPQVSDDGLEAVGKEVVSGRQVVEDDHLMTAAGERARRVASDIACTACYENAHFIPVRLPF
jgi:hypothetical protein